MAETTNRTGTRAAGTKATKATGTRARSTSKQTQTKGEVAETKPKRTRATNKTTDKQTQANSAKPKTGGRGKRKDSQKQSLPLSEALGRSRQHIGGEKQGADASGKAGDGGSNGIVRGGTAKVAIQTMAMPARIVGREPKPEEYPFGDLNPSKKVGGEIVGDSFFIPMSAGAKQKLASGRKRHKGTTFWTRATMEKIDGKGDPVAGIRIWKAPASA